ncbi:MAG TPA: hypothetical protein VKV95_02485 [Terriglobia bacterium]|nr:hypothetical protein [Terriglobia bacterium]
MTAMGAGEKVFIFHDRTSTHGNRFHPDVEMGRAADQPQFIQLVNFSFKSPDQAHLAKPAKSGLDGNFFQGHLPCVLQDN